MNFEIEFASPAIVVSDDELSAEIADVDFEHPLGAIF